MSIFLSGKLTWKDLFSDPLPALERSQIGNVVFSHKMRLIHKMHKICALSPIKKHLIPKDNPNLVSNHSRELKTQLDDDKMQKVEIWAKSLKPINTTRNAFAVKIRTSNLPTMSLYEELLVEECRNHSQNMANKLIANAHSFELEWKYRKTPDKSWGSWTKAQKQHDAIGSW